MAVPKTAMGENHCLVTWEHNVWLSGESTVVQAKAKTFGEEPLSEQNFWSGIPAPDTGHHPGTGHPVDDVRHPSHGEWYLQNEGCLCFLKRHDMRFHDPGNLGDDGNHDSIPELLVCLCI